MNPLEIASMASPKRTSSPTAAPSLTSSTSLQGLSAEEQSNLTFQNVQDTISCENFNLLLNNKPGLLTLTEDSWSCCVQSQGTGKFYVHFKFHRKERLKKLASYFPNLDLSLKRISAEEEPPKNLKDSTLSRRIVVTHEEYQKIKKKEENGSTNGKGLFFQGIMSKQDFNHLLNSYAILLCLNKNSWSLKIDENSFVVKLSLLQEFVRYIEPTQFFGDKLASLLTEVEVIGVPESYQGNKDELKLKVQESYKCYVEVMNARAQRRPKKLKKNIVDEEIGGGEGRKDKAKLSNQHLSSPSMNMSQASLKLPQQAQKVEPPKDLPLDLLSNLISRAQEANFQPRFPNNKTVPTDFSTQNPVSYTEKRYSENPNFAEKIEKNEKLDPYVDKDGNAERVKQEKGTFLKDFGERKYMKEDLNQKSLFSTAQNISQKPSKVDQIPEKFEMLKPVDAFHHPGYDNPRFGQVSLKNTQQQKGQLMQEETKKEEKLDFFPNKNLFTSSNETSEQPQKHQEMENLRGQGLGIISEIANKGMKFPFQEQMNENRLNNQSVFSNKCLFSTGNTTYQNLPTLPQRVQKANILRLTDLVNQSERLPFPQQKLQSERTFAADFPNRCLFSTSQNMSQQSNKVPQRSQAIEMMRNPKEKKVPLPNDCLFATIDNRSKQPQNVPEKAQEAGTPKRFNFEAFTSLLKEIHELTLKEKTQARPAENAGGLRVIPEEDEKEDLVEQDMKRLEISAKGPSQKAKLLMKELAEEVEFHKCLKEITEDFKNLKATDRFDLQASPKESFYINWGHLGLQAWWDHLKIEDKRRMSGIFFTEGTTDYWEKQAQEQWKRLNSKKRRYNQITPEVTNNASDQEIEQPRIIKKIKLNIRPGQGLIPIWQNQVAPAEQQQQQMVASEEQEQQQMAEGQEQEIAAAEEQEHEQEEETAEEQENAQNEKSEDEETEEHKTE